MSPVPELDDACRWLHEWLERITYRPGWTFRCHIDKVMAGDPGRLVMNATLSTRDVNAPRTLGLAKMTLISTERDATGLARHRDGGLVAAFLHDMVAEVEAHERFEHLRHGGTPLFDPHPGDGPPRTSIGEVGYEAWRT